jgi:hypothetical protein
MLAIVMGLAIHALGPSSSLSDAATTPEALFAAGNAAFHEAAAPTRTPSSATKRS